MAKPADWIVGITVLAVVFSFVFIAVALFSDDSNGGEFFSSGSAIAVVDIKGAIFSSESTIKELKRWKRNSAVKAIVLNINSPGGGVAASHEIYDFVKKVKESGLPVIVYFGTVAASGGYYIGVAGTEIVANPNTMTGSIGVIMEMPSVNELLDKVGLGFETIISGKFKDSGNPAREMRAEEREYFQNLVDDNYKEFVRIVAEGRNLSEEEVIKFADGRVFTGRQALELDMVDRLGTFEDALLRAKEIAGLKFDAPVRKIKREKSTLYSLFFEDLVSLIETISPTPVAQFMLR